MPTQSAQELEARLEATLREIGGTDLDFVLALEREMEGAAPCGLAPLFKEELHEAAMELSARERGMGDFENGSMTERRDRLESAEERFWRASDADCEHRSTCPCCLANRFKVKNNFA